MPATGVQTVNPNICERFPDLTFCPKTPSEPPTTEPAPVPTPDQPRDYYNYDRGDHNGWETTKEFVGNGTREISKALIEEARNKLWEKIIMKWLGKAAAHFFGRATAVVGFLWPDEVADARIYNSKGERIYKSLSPEEQKDLLNSLKMKDMAEFERKVEEATDKYIKETIKNSRDFTTVTIHERREVNLEAIAPSLSRRTSPRPH
jgi:hypothetical protein